MEAFPLDIQGRGNNVTCQGMCPEYLTRILQRNIGRWQRQVRGRRVGKTKANEPQGGCLYAESLGCPPGRGAEADREVYHTTDAVQMQNEDGNSSGVGAGGVEGGNEEQSQWVGSSRSDMALPGSIPSGTDICGGEGT